MLAICGGNKSEAARRLGISRPRLVRLLAGGADASELRDDAAIESDHHETSEAGHA
jgi:hypothetical protein